MASILEEAVTMMSRLFRILGGIGLLGLLCGCASTLESTMDYDQQFDFSTVRKIAIQPVDRTELSTITRWPPSCRQKASKLLPITVRPTCISPGTW